MIPQDLLKRAWLAGVGIGRQSPSADYVMVYCPDEHELFTVPTKQDIDRAFATGPVSCEDCVGTEYDRDECTTEEHCGDREWFDPDPIRALGWAMRWRGKRRFHYADVGDLDEVVMLISSVRPRVTVRSFSMSDGLTADLPAVADDTVSEAMAALTLIAVWYDEHGEKRPPVPDLGIAPFVATLPTCTCHGPVGHSAGCRMNGLIRPTPFDIVELDGDTVRYSDGSTRHWDGERWAS